MSEVKLPLSRTNVEAAIKRLRDQCEKLEKAAGEQRLPDVIQELVNKEVRLLRNSYLELEEMLRLKYVANCMFCKVEHQQEYSNVRTFICRSCDEKTTGRR